MADAAPTILLFLAVLGAAGTVYALVALWRLLRAFSAVPTLRAGLSREAGKGTPPSVCIIVPAHNESRVIAGIATSLHTLDDPSLRFVFALDRCTDDTAAILRRVLEGDERAEIVEITSCPEGWAGKPNAARVAVESSGAAQRADVLLFADADTIFDPGCVRAAVGLLESRDLALVSVLSTLEHRTWFESVVQPATSLELMRHFPLDRVNKGKGMAFANGQFLMFRRDAYERIGGHAAVREELLEDLAFARLVRRAGLRTGVFLADGLLRCRMYGDYSAFRRGWKRIFTEAARRRPGRLRRWALQLLLTGVALPLGSLAALAGGLLLGRHAEPPLPGACIALGAIGFAGWLAAVGAIHAIQRAPLWSVLVHPAGAAICARLLWEAAGDLKAGRAVEWGGKAYVRPTR